MGNDHRNFRYTFGIEEEFFLVHPRSRTIATSVPRSLLHACRRRYGDAVAPELLHSQIELVSPVFERCDEAYDEMLRLGRGVAAIAAQKRLRLLLRRARTRSRPGASSPRRRRIATGA